MPIKSRIALPKCRRFFDDWQAGLGIVVTAFGLTGCTSVLPLLSAKPTLTHSTVVNAPVTAADQLIFIRSMGSGAGRRSELMRGKLNPNDGQLSNLQVLHSVQGNLLSLSASRDGRNLVFTQQVGKTYPLIYHLSLETGRLSQVSPTTTQNFSGSLSPDGQKLLYASSVEGNPEIYVTKHSAKTPQRLTFDAAADIAPVWLDDLSFLFTSDRLGSQQPQLYYFSLSSQHMQRLNLSGNYNAVARVSPTGDMVSYTSSKGIAKVVPISAQYPEQVLEQAGVTIDMKHTGEPINFLPDGSAVIYALDNQIYRQTIVKTPQSDGKVILKLGQLTLINTDALLNINTDAKANGNKKVVIYEPIVVRSH